MSAPLTDEQVALRDRIADVLYQGDWTRSREKAEARADAVIPVVRSEVDRLHEQVRVEAGSIRNLEVIVGRRTRERDEARASLERRRAERDVATSRAKEWHDTYQQYANASDALLTELLELLPGSTDTGADAWDQLPRAVERLTRERDEARAELVALRDRAAEPLPPGAFSIGSTHAWGDPPLVCTRCGVTTCTVVAGDDLDVLVRTAVGHQCAPGAIGEQP